LAHQALVGSPYLLACLSLIGVYLSISTSSRLLQLPFQYLPLFFVGSITDLKLPSLRLLVGFQFFGENLVTWAFSPFFPGCRRTLNWAPFSVTGGLSKVTSLGIFGPIILKMGVVSIKFPFSL